MGGQISARRVLTPTGWLCDAAVAWDRAGTITTVGPEQFDAAAAYGTVIPGLANVHTHSFQRAMAGLAERRGPDGSDDFWTWRQTMYRFLEVLRPEHIEAIAAKVQMDMALAGYTASAEFHYLHHQPGGGRYDNPAELSARILAASLESGIGLTHLPVLYSFGGTARQGLNRGQSRFGCNPDEFARLYGAVAAICGDMPGDFRLGVAPHSLRAVDRDGIDACLALCPQGPIHIHAAEQVKEVAEVEAHLGARPVRWLLDNCEVDARWCLIHATHMDKAEITGLAASGAAAGLCPTTEANLGDGIFPAREYLANDGEFGIGSDSNIRLSVTEELRMLEVSQRLLHRQRTVLTSDADRSNARNMIERAARGGARAIGRPSGAIEPGRLADLVALRDDDPLLDWNDPDTCLDSWVFGCETQAVGDVWSAGRHIVRDSRHRRAEAIEGRFRRAMHDLKQAL